MGADGRPLGFWAAADPRVKIAVGVASVLVFALVASLSGRSQDSDSATVVVTGPAGARGSTKRWTREKELALAVEQDFIQYLRTLEVPTLVSLPRRTMSLQLALHALVHDVPGDFVETGVYKGGMSILLLKLLEHLDRQQRKFWGADSFEGLPGMADADKKGDFIDWKGELASGVETFVENMKAFDVYDKQRVQIVKGWFNESLPGIRDQIPAISFLRLDGDLYVSTRDALVNLYPLVSPCGLVYIDDYGSFPGCKVAVDEYRLQHNIKAPIHTQAIPEPWGPPGEPPRKEGAWWMVPCPV
jgi:hypothetical protein